MTARRLFWLLALALLPLFVGLSRDFGATWDEFQQHDKARRLLEYWTGARTALDEPTDGAHLYGAPIDVVTLSVASTLRQDPYLVGHAINAIVGWAGLLAAGLLARRLFSDRHGLLTMALLAATPQYIAHSMNNPKDLPFATVTTACLLAMTYVRRTVPLISARVGVVFALIVGIGLNVRAGMLMFVGYLAVLCGYYLRQAGAMPSPASLRVAARIGAITFGAVLIGWLAWPWAYDHPLTASFRAMRELSRFPWDGIVLFGGEDRSSLALPPAYIPTWIWMGLPLVMTAGAAVAIALAAWRPERDAIVALVAVVAFPIVYVVGTGATLYDAARHLLFVVPPLAVLASAGWLALADSGSQRRRLLVALAVAVGLAEPIVFTWRNHPNEGVYIQPLAGGPRGAFGRYDLDYWGNCMFQAMTDLSREHRERVRVTGWPLLVLQMNASRFGNLEVVGDDAEYSIELVRGRRDHVLRLASMPDVVARVTTADGAVLCVTRKAAEALPPAIFR